MADDLPDLYSIYSAPDEATAADRARALAAALRGQQGVGMLAQLSGDKTLGSFGRGLLDNAGQQQEGLIAAPGARLKQAVQGQQLAEAQRKYAAQTDPASLKFLQGAAKRYGFDAGDAPAPVLEQTLPTMERAHAAEESTAVRREQARTNADLRRTMQETQLANQRERLDMRGEQFNERELQGLGKSDQKNTAAMAALEAAKRFAERMSTPEGASLPGIGRLQGMVPTWFSPDAWQENQADAAELAKSVLLMKGGAITPEAIHLQQKALGLASGSDVETFKKGLGVALDEIASKLRQHQSGYRPENVSEFERRGGVTASVLDELRGRVAGLRGGNPAAEHARSQLQSGERLVRGPKGDYAALAASEAIPQGYTEVR